jgi:ribosome-associated protein
MTIRVTARIAIEEAELSEDFLRASGPGGQNVNKLETAVQLRFDAMASPNLPTAVKERLVALAGRRMTKDGVLVITAQRHRTRERNREDALERLLGLLRDAATPPPPPRRATRPSRAAKARRVDEKTRRGTTKRLRSTRPED